MGVGRLTRPSAWIAALTVLSAAFTQASRADDPEKLLALFFDGMRNRDYQKVMEGMSGIVALDGKAPAEGQAECFSALKSGVLARAEPACRHFAEISERDPRAHLGMALVDVIAERPLDAVKSLDAALKIDPRNLPAHLLRRTLAEGGVGQVGDGWAVPNAGAKVTLDKALTAFAEADYRAAAAGFETMVNQGQTTGKVPLMLFIARKRAGLSTGNELEPMLDLGGARYKMLISALKGEATPKEAWRTFIETWAEGDDYGSNRFFLGQAALIQGDKTAAKRYFSNGAAVKQDTIEARLSRSELARLD